MAFWIELAVDAPPAAAEALAAALLVAGCRGVIQDETRPGETRPLARVRGFLPYPQPDLPRKLRALGRAQKDCVRYGLDTRTRRVRRRYVLEDDWAEGWKAHFRPTRIGRRLVIVPSWEEFAPEPEVLVIELDPGMAFGTGAHATTRLCLEELERLADAGRLGPVIDVGTGSGILAIAAAKLGARPIVALDNDPIAIPIAAENAHRNGVAGDIRFQVGELAGVPGKARVVVANILAEVVIALLPEVVAHLEPGGAFVASGIVQARAGDVQAALAAAGFTGLQRRDEGEWSLVAGQLSP